MAHIDYILDGKPTVTPILQWREGDRMAQARAETKVRSWA